MLCNCISVETKNLAGKVVGQYEKSRYKSYDKLPLLLNADTVAKMLGMSPSSGYELMHKADFPVLKVGSRMVVPKEKFVDWVEYHTMGGGRE